MLQHLSIRDFAIVDRLDLEFRPGFTALTGETGAGKSILIDALSLTLGDRAGSEQVRSGAERADVSAEFAIDSLPGVGDWLREHALEGDPNRLLLRRVVDANGRSRAFINGHAATINQMREVGDGLVDIHGQHAHQSLLRPEAQRAALGVLSGVLSRLRPLTEFDGSLRDTIAVLESGEAHLREGAYALRHYADRIELDPKRLHEVEERLEAVHNAARKFRARPEALPELLASLQVRVRDLEMTADLEALAAQEQAARSRYDELAGRLSAERSEAATKIGREVDAAMKELAKSGGRFEVELRSLLPDGSVAGNEQVEFLVATNPGTEPRALAKVASGGELSRISLAIQVITSRAAAVPTLIFDEVDAGIGGAVAEVVGRKLKTLGGERQVLCVTHLPQVGAQAREQWSVSKGPESGSARGRGAGPDPKSPLAGNRPSPGGAGC